MTTYILLGLLSTSLALLMGGILLTTQRRARKVTLSARPVLEPDSGALFARLRLALPQYVILSRVSLAAFIDARSANPGSQAAARAGLAGQRVDFLICGEDFHVIAAIELDDLRVSRCPHGQGAELLRRASIPLLRWNTVSLPTLRDIQETVAELETLRLIRLARVEPPMRARPVTALSGGAFARIDRRRSPR